MRKALNIFLVFLITLFTIPFGGLNVSAEGNDSVTPDKAYEIDYTILDEDRNSSSIADDFFTKPGIVLEYDGKTYLQMTVDGADMIKAFSNEYGEYVLVDRTAESMTMQLRVPNDLSDMKLDMHIVVPAGAIPGFPGYDEKHSAILSINQEIKKDLNVADYNIIISDGGNGPSVEVTEPEEDLGDSGDTGSDNDGKDESGEGSVDEENKLDLSNGSYTFDVEYLRSDNDNPSSMGNYLGNSAFVEVKDGKAELTITVTNKDAVTKLQVAGQDPVEVVEDDDNRYERFLLNSLAGTTDAYVEYQASYGDSVWEGNATFRIVLDEETKEEAKATDKPGYGLLVTPEKKDLSLDNGYYTADVTYYHAEDNKGSAMANYLGKTLFLEVKDGAVELTVTVDDNEAVTLLQVEGKNPVEVVKDREKNYETFKLDTLTTLYNAYTEYQAPFGDSIFESQADFRIVIDEDSLEKASKNDKPGYVEKEYDDKDSGKGHGKGKGEGDDEKISLKPDKAYEIMYTILQKDGNSVSVADGFFKKPGILLEHDGKTYFQMTVESADMIKSLSNEYGDYLTVADHKDGSRTIQLRVPNDLSDMKLDMHIVVPAGAIPGFPGYDEKHSAILTFDKDSKKEISVEGLEVTPSGDKNNLNGPYVEGATTPGGSEGDNNGKQPDKPELGENGDNKKGEKADDNPKTGDTSQILFFSTLLVASLSVLVLQVRRRLAA